MVHAVALPLSVIRALDDMGGKISAMPDYECLYNALANTPLSHWPSQLRGKVKAALDPASHGDLRFWQAALNALPRISPSSVELTADCLRIGDSTQLSLGQRELLIERLKAFHPWRKGPFCLFGIHLDTEWRSDWKWNRLRDALVLKGKRILDVGCGNGYYGWRMLGDGADLVVGVDPTLRFVMQYAALSRFIGPVPNYVLPLRLEELPEGNGGFDTVFSMGVLYHRRDPLEHLTQLKAHLGEGGQVVLETLVIQGEAKAILAPEGRYAKMRNVWNIPSVTTLKDWMRKAGLRDVRTIDVTPTTVEEQRPTEWMTFHSLPHFLDPRDAKRTVEGYPAPIRAVVIGDL
nr:tRNA 5-methoxyuridine(34)/uridine 5-oxyacetic acid(34) synthase CmoB [Thiohalomonas denitrificans]